MADVSSRFSACGRLLAGSLIGLLWGGFGSFAASEAEEGNPHFVRGSLIPSGVSSVLSVVSTREADLVLLGGGAEEGFGRGMLCVVRRSGDLVSEIVLAEVDRRRAVGLIVELFGDRTIHPGDRVQIKTSIIH